MSEQLTIEQQRERDLRDAIERGLAEWVNETEGWFYYFEEEKP